MESTHLILPYHKNTIGNSYARNLQLPYKSYLDLKEIVPAIASFPTRNFNVINFERSDVLSTDAISSIKRYLCANKNFKTDP